MHLDTTLEGLNTFIKEAFSEKAIPHLRLRVEIAAPNPRVLGKVYPAGLPAEEYLVYDAALQAIECGGRKVGAIKAVREAAMSLNLPEVGTLKGGKGFVERWFPETEYA